MTQEEQNFINTISQLAQKDMERTGVLASLTVAQAILESGWGKSGLATKGNALFGIKATSSWKGAVYNGKTKECYDGKTMVTVDGCFRAYDSWEESVKNHGDLLSKSSRYKAVVGETDYKKACEAIAKAGYATDPSYTQKLINIIEQYELYKYDSIQIGDVSTSQPQTGSVPSGVATGTSTVTGGGANSTSSSVGGATPNTVGNVIGGIGTIGAGVIDSVITIFNGFGNNTILVNPSELIEKSNQILKYSEQHKEMMNKMTNLIMNIGEVWQGEAQIAFINKYSSMQNVYDSFERALEDFASLMKEAAESIQNADISGKTTINSIN